MNGKTGYPVLVENLWAGHEALRRCGFSADDIFVSLGKEGQPVFSQLRIDGKEFNITCGVLDMDPDRLTELWEEFVTKFNGAEFDDDVLHDVFMTALGKWGGAMRLLTALAKRGIDAPSVGDGSAAVLKACEESVSKVH